VSGKDLMPQSNDSTHNPRREGAVIHMSWKGSDHSWSRGSILMNVPNASGVYLIWNTNGCIYVGETHDLQRRLLDHHDHPTPCMLKQGPPTAFGFEVCSIETRTRKHSSLSETFHPRCSDQTC
jgi:hypothetical protein